MADYQPDASGILLPRRRRDDPRQDRPISKGWKFLISLVVSVPLGEAIKSLARGLRDHYFFTWLSELISGVLGNFAFADALSLAAPYVVAFFLPVLVWFAMGRRKKRTIAVVASVWFVVAMLTVSFIGYANAPTGLVVGGIDRGNEIPRYVLVAALDKIDEAWRHARDMRNVVSGAHARILAWATAPEPFDYIWGEELRQAEESLYVLSNQVAAILGSQIVDMSVQVTEEEMLIPSPLEELVDERYIDFNFLEFDSSEISVRKAAVRRAYYFRQRAMQRIAELEAQIGQHRLAVRSRLDTISGE